MIVIEKSGIRFSFAPETCVVTLTNLNTGVSVTQKPYAPAANIEAREDAVSFEVNGLSCTYALERDGSLLLSIASTGPMTEETSFPPAFQPENSDRNLYAIASGVCIDAEEEAAFLPNRLELSEAHGSCMSFYGILRGGCGLLCAVETPYDAAFVLQRENGLWETETVWKPQKGFWGYPRVMRFALPEGGVTEICKAYREIAKRRGLVVTLDEKAKKVPNARRLAGSANVWLWNDDAMDKLYTENFVYHAPTEEMVDLRIRRAREMKEMGMEHIMWSMFDENTEKREVDAVKELGYLPSYYDVYTDVIPHEILELIPPYRRARCSQRLGCYPDGVVRDADGNPVDAWPLKCVDGVFRSQKRTCELAAIDCMKDYVGGHTLPLGVESQFLDVTYMGAMECYDERHPTTREQCVAAKADMMQWLQEQGMVRGTEVGTEEAAATVEYNEGMMSPLFFRAYDSGRRMTHIYEGESLPPQIKDYMLNPKYRVPLWQLVFHDCMVSYWYWGDSHNCCPELMNERDLFCCLYGEPPLFSVANRDWDRLKGNILKSYQTVSPVAKAVWGREMLRFDYVDGEPMVQRSEFAGGVTVTVDFRTGDCVVEAR